VWRGRRQVAPRASGGTLPGRSRKRPFVFSIRQWLYLGTTIVAEVIATSVLKASEGFTRLVPSLVVLAGYATAFYFLSLTLRTIPLGIAYAIWSAVGIALVSVIGSLIYRQSLDAPALIGIGLIVAGVVVINGFSKSVAH